MAVCDGIINALSIIQLHQNNKFTFAANLHNKMVFEELNLNTALLRALDELGYIYPTPIQQKAFPVIMSGRDMVGIAQTGTGKTFAYLMPLLRQITYSDQRDPRILILVPTRELVLQVVDEIKKLATYITVRFAGVYGGTNINTQKQVIYDGLDILVATPGRLADLALCGVLRTKSIQKLVIDEVDEMLNLGFRAQLLSILDMLPQKRQNLMFSATLTNDVEALIHSFTINPEKIEISMHGTPLEKIIQRAYHVPNYFTKVNLLEHLLSTDNEMNKVLIFVSGKKLADRLFEQLDKTFPDQVGVMHSNKSQNYRINALKRFEEGTHRMLIATDIIARGLDIYEISHVINFDTPDVPGDYIHRIGRTGRADKDGIAITFINQPEQTYQMDIEKLMNKPIQLFPIPEEVAVSQVFSEEERPVLHDKDYMKSVSRPSIKGTAFQDKKDKNKKINNIKPRDRYSKLGKPVNRQLKKKR
jgi:ATP-dependent RNA helicase RhlE